MLEHGYLLLLTLPGILPIILPLAPVDAKSEAFRFFDGSRTRIADLHAAFCVLHRDPFLDIEDLLDRTRQGDLEAVHSCAVATRKAFNIDCQKTGRGLSDLELLLLLVNFEIYLEARYAKCSNRS